jgi:hypothetical protein
LNLDGQFNFPEALEVILMKRFQEMFSCSSCPKDVLLLFFDTPKFGQCTLALCQTVRQMAKVTSGGPGMRLQDVTVSVHAWPILMNEMDSFTSLCLKPLPLSSSSDIIFAGELTYRSEKLRYTIGVASKNYQGKKTGKIEIENECSKFNAMFRGSNSDFRMNILIFCSTDYGKDTKKKFGDQNFFVMESEEFPFIDEVIVLDLTTPAKRATFFGLAPSDILNQCIDRVLEKGTPYTTPWIEE